MDQDYKRAILEILSEPFARGSQMAGDENTPPRRVHKSNLIGRGEWQPGEIEHHLGITFNPEDRSRAARSFDELRRNGHIESTYDDLVDPDNWVVITELGREYLAADLRDDIDEQLLVIGQHLPEIRLGMKDAVIRTSADAPRQAANGARELLDQVLREGAPADLKTRKERFKHLMRAHHGEHISQTDLAILEANADLIEAEHNKMVKEAHARYAPSAKDAQSCVDAVERILELIFGQN